MTTLPGKARPEDKTTPEATSSESSAEDDILQVLRSGERFVVCSHAHPDGDAVGSMLAMSMILEQMEKHVDVLSADRIPENCSFLPCSGRIRTALRPSGQYDAAILLECDGTARTRLSGLDDYFLINIDHHLSGQPFGQLNWIDSKAVSVGEMVYRLALAAGVTLTADMAACLYTSLLTDTGGFCYGHLQASTFAFAQALVLAGANPTTIAHQVFFSVRTSRMLLLGAALHNLRHDGRIAWLWISYQDMLRSCASEEDCGGVVNYAAGIAGVEAAVFLRELPDHRYRLSLRSRGRVNVATLAESMGGGGHEAAAGCYLNGPLSAALNCILPALRKAVAASLPEPVHPPS